MKDIFNGRSQISFSDEVERATLFRDVRFLVPTDDRDDEWAKSKTSEAVKSFAEGIQNTSFSKITLSLADSKITDDAVKSLADQIKNTSLKKLTLTLRDTKIGDASLIKLGECLPVTSEELNIVLEACSEISDEGVKGLALVVQKTPLKKLMLNLNCTKIGDASLIRLG